MRLSPAWSAELDLNDAPLRDRFGGRTIHLYGAALVLQRVFWANRGFASYVSIGTGVTHLAPPSDIGLKSRTEFMVQPDLGALVNVWKSRDCCRSLV